MNRKIKVLIVDDSAFMRKSLSIILSADSEIEIADFAKDGIEAIEKAKSIRPDVITLDIEMPRMDGLTALRTIMKEAPTSVIMVSSLTTEGAEATLQALELGAVDFIPKEMSFVSVNMGQVKKDLIRKIKTIVRQKFLKERLENLKTEINGKESRKVPIPTNGQLPKNKFNSIAIGISTGGPLSLQKVIPQLTVKVPVFIVQHMPPKFTKSLANRLNSLSKLTVKEAEDSEEVRSGFVYIAPGGMQMNVKKNLAGKRIIKVFESDKNILHKPSVDIMLSSVVDEYGTSVLGVIMTGMGHDGLEGIKKLKSKGGYCLAQDESSSVVYGMPKAIVDNQLADVVAPLDRIPKILNEVA